MNKKEGFISILLDLLVVMLLMLIFVPQFQILSFYNYLCLLVGITWFVISFIQHPQFYLGKNHYFIISFLFCLITMMIPLVLDIPTIFNRYASLTLVPFFYWLYSYNTTYRGIKSNLRIVLFSLIPILYTTFQTIRALLESPWAARAIKTSGDQSIELWIKGVSGYTLVYAVVILALTLIPVILGHRKLQLSSIKFVIFLSLLLFFFILIVLSNYFTALLLFCMGCFLLLLLQNKVLLVIFVPVFFFYILLQKEINVAVIETVMSITPSEGRNYDRLAQLRAKVLFGGEAEDVDSRSEVMGLSVALMAEYPIAGYLIGGKNFQLERVGQHSHILDTCAFYGIFVGIFCLWVMWLPFKYRITKTYHYKLRMLSWVIGGSFMVLITFNLLTPSIGFAAFFVFPTIYDYLKNKIYG